MSIPYPAQTGPPERQRFILPAQALRAVTDDTRQAAYRLIVELRLRDASSGFSRTRSVHRMMTPCLGMNPGNIFLIIYRQSGKWRLGFSPLVWFLAIPASSIAPFVSSCWHSQAPGRYGSLTQHRYRRCRRSFGKSRAYRIIDPFTASVGSRCNNSCGSRSPDGWPRQWRRRSFLYGARVLGRFFRAAARIRNYH